MVTLNSSLFNILIHKKHSLFYCDQRTKLHIIYINPHCVNVSSQTNTFQCILTTDGTFSFAIFLYADNLIQWSRGELSEVDAQAGFNAGDNETHLTINGSQTPAIVDIENTSNIGVPGKYVFRIDDTTIAATPPGMEFNQALNFAECVCAAECD